jgi:multicomponent Na+:H+ antiporter subunit F
VNAYEWAAAVLLLPIAPCVAFCLRARPVDGLVGLQVSGSLTTVALLCLAEGYHRSSYFAVALVAAVSTWIGGLVVARFLARGP